MHWVHAFTSAKFSGRQIVDCRLSDAHWPNTALPFNKSNRLPDSSTNERSPLEAHWPDTFVVTTDTTVSCVNTTDKTASCVETTDTSVSCVNTTDRRRGNGGDWSGRE